MQQLSCRFKGRLYEDKNRCRKKSRDDELHSMVWYMVNDAVCNDWMCKLAGSRVQNWHRSVQRSQ